MKKIKNPIIIEGVALLFSWIFGLAIDEVIQKGIIQNPDSHKFYQLMMGITNADNIIMPFFVFLWVIGSLLYIFNKLRE